MSAPPETETITKTVELPERLARALVGEAESHGVGAELIYPSSLGGLFAVVLSFHFDVELRGASVVIRPRFDAVRFGESPAWGEGPGS